MDYIILARVNPVLHLRKPHLIDFVFVSRGIGKCRNTLFTIKVQRTQFLLDCSPAQNTLLNTLNLPTPFASQPFLKRVQVPDCRERMAKLQPHMDGRATDAHSDVWRELDRHVLRPEAAVTAHAVGLYFQHVCKYVNDTRLLRKQAHICTIWWPATQKKHRWRRPADTLVSLPHPPRQHCGVLLLSGRLWSCETPSSGRRRPV